MSNDSGRESSDDDEVSPDDASFDDALPDASFDDDTGVSPLESMVGGIEDAIAGVHLHGDDSDGDDSDGDSDGDDSEDEQ